MAHLTGLLIYALCIRLANRILGASILVAHQGSNNDCYVLKRPSREEVFSGWVRDMRPAGGTMRQEESGPSYVPCISTLEGLSLLFKVSM